MDAIVAWGHRSDWREALQAPPPLAPSSSRPSSSEASWVEAMGSEPADGDEWLRVSPDELEAMLQGRRPQPTPSAEAKPRTAPPPPAPFSMMTTTTAADLTTTMTGWTRLRGWPG